MAKLKYAIDSPHTKPWVERIGKVILNFSGIELESVRWLQNLAETDKEHELFTMSFASRVTELMRQIESRSSAPRWRKESLRAWNDALRLAKVRNQIAHNPVIFGWSSPLEAGEPEFIGIPATRTRGRAGKHGHLSRSRIDQGINEMVVLVGKLETLRVEWCELRDKGLVPAVFPTPPLLARVVRALRLIMYARRARITGKQ